MQVHGRISRLLLWKWVSSDTAHYTIQIMAAGSVFSIIKINLGLAIYVYDLRLLVRWRYSYGCHNTNLLTVITKRVMFHDLVHDTKIIQNSEIQAKICSQDWVVQSQWVDRVNIAHTSFINQETQKIGWSCTFGFHLSEKINPCTNEPCVNGGTCVQDKVDFKLFTCQCTRGYKGKTCDGEDAMLIGKCYNIKNKNTKVYT